jgi:hypothetical protein
MSCDICCETVKKKVSCGSCALSVCVPCLTQFCQTSPSVDVVCMQCKTLWDTEFIVKNVSRSFLHTHKKCVEKLLIDREKSQLPETQWYLQYDRAMETVVRPELEQASREAVRLERTIAARVEDHCSEHEYFDLQFRYKRCKRHCTRLSRHLEAWKYQLHMTYDKYIPEPLRKQQNQNTTEKVLNVFPCAKTECRGYVNSDFCCGTCESRYCPKCFQSKVSTDHSCKPEDIQTAKEIDRSSKPCPKCSVRIHKIDGCDQMWCTQCHTAFSWNTGKVEQNEIHNPHYYEWFRGTHKQEPPAVGRMPGLCDRRPPRMHLLTHMGILFTVGSETYDYFVERLRLNTHVRYVEIDQHFSRRDYETRNNLDLRLRWLKNTISPEHLGRVLYKRRKECVVNARRVGIFQLYVDASDDLFRRLLYECNDSTEAEAIQIELDHLIAYVNTCFDELRAVYKMKMPVIRFHEYNHSFELGGYTGFLPME